MVLLCTILKLCASHKEEWHLSSRKQRIGECQHASAVFGAILYFLFLRQKINPYNSGLLQAVEALILIDSQGFIDGIGPMANLPRPLARLGVSVLRSVPLRQLANNMAYYNNEFASDDAMRVGRLHTFLSGSY